MRAILFVLILAVVALIVAVATGFLDLRQTQPAKAPQIDADRGGVTARGGQPPAFDIETGSVTVGTRQTNVAVPVPSLQVNPPEAQQPAEANESNQTAPQPAE